MFFDTVIVCSVTGSTQAGMIAGLRGQRARERRVIGIDASAKPDRDARAGRSDRAFTAAPSASAASSRDDEIILDERYHAGIYGIPDARRSMRCAPPRLEA